MSVATTRPSATPIALAPPLQRVGACRPGDPMAPTDLLPHTSAPAADERRNGSRALSRAECEAWIARHHEARLGYQTGRGHRSVVVPYILAAHEVVLVLPEYHPATGYLLDAPVTLDVEASAVRGAWEDVRVSGVAYPAADPEVAPGWPDGVATHTVRIPLTRLEGVLRED